jgi:hypothetical protein
MAYARQGDRRFAAAQKRASSPSLHRRRRAGRPARSTAVSSRSRTDWGRVLYRGVAIGLASAAAIVIAAPADGQTPAGEVVLDTVNANTPVSAYGGVAVWSAFDPASKTYRLRAYRGGHVSDVPVPPRRSPFDADVGPDATGQPVVVYSRCRVDPTGGLFFNELPE